MRFCRLNSTLSTSLHYDADTLKTDFDRNIEISATRSQSQCVIKLLNASCLIQHTCTKLPNLYPLIKQTDIIREYLFYKSNIYCLISRMSWPWPLFTKRSDVLTPNLAKSRSHEIGRYNGRIALKFDMHLDSVTVEAPVKLQTGCKI